MMNEILHDSLVGEINLFDNYEEINFDAVVRGSQNLRGKLSFANGCAQQGICVLASRSAKYVASIIAAWHAGFYVVPLNTAWPKQKNLDIIARINPVAVLVDSDELLDIDCQCLNIDVLFDANNLAADAHTMPLCGRMLPSDIAYIIFTSGSTGEPKGVVISAGAFRSYIEWTRRFFADYSAAKKLLLTSELTFDITMGDIAFALAFGTDIGVARQHTNIPSVLALIMQYEIDVLYSVPTTHLALVNFAQHKKGANLSSLKLILSGGDRFPWQLVRDYSSLTGGGHFYNVYGPTEVTINCFAVRLDDKLYLAEQGKSVPIGECFDTLDYVLIDADGRVANEGELCVTGPQLMLGYHGDKERTEKAFIPDPRISFIHRPLYRTGDLGYQDSGLMYLKGRIDNLIKVRGYRIHPDEVSKAIDTLDGVDASAVVSFGEQSDAALAAFIKPKRDVVLNIEILIENLKMILPGYMIPTQFYIVEQFPLNQSGKIDKKSLAKGLK